MSQFKSKLISYIKILPTCEGMNLEKGRFYNSQCEIIHKELNRQNFAFNNF